MSQTEPIRAGGPLETKDLKGTGFIATGYCKGTTKRARRILLTNLSYGLHYLFNTMTYGPHLRVSPTT
jgi:hypothetical protein